MFIRLSVLQQIQGKKLPTAAPRRWSPRFAWRDVFLMLFGVRNVGVCTCWSYFEWCSVLGLQLCWVWNWKMQRQAMLTFDSHMREAKRAERFGGETAMRKKKLSIEGFNGFRIEPSDYINDTKRYVSQTLWLNQNLLLPRTLVPLPFCQSWVLNSTKCPKVGVFFLMSAVPMDMKKCKNATNLFCCTENPSPPVFV